MKQIALALYDNPDVSFSDIVPHSGISEAIKTLQIALESTAGVPTQIFIYGPTGSGKTLLLKALYHALRSRSSGVAHTVILNQMSDPETREHGLESIAAMEREKLLSISEVLIDDVDKIPDVATNHLWNLWNHLITTGGRLVCSSTMGPEEIFSGNRHLSSRMISGLSIELTPPDDSSRVLILDRMAEKRGVRLSHDVISYLISRKSRNLKTLEEILRIIDNSSLEEKRRVTLKFIKELETQAMV